MTAGEGRLMPRCAQCGTTTGEVWPSVHGLLCAPCSHRQAEHDEPGYGLAPGTYGFTED